MNNLISVWTEVILQMEFLIFKYQTVIFNHIKNSNDKLT